MRGCNTCEFKEEGVPEYLQPNCKRGYVVSDKITDCHAWKEKTKEKCWCEYDVGYRTVTIDAVNQIKILDFAPPIRRLLLIKFCPVCGKKL